MTSPIALLAVIIRTPMGDPSALPLPHVPPPILPGVAGRRAQVLADPGLVGVHGVVLAEREVEDLAQLRQQFRVLLEGPVAPLDLQMKPRIAFMRPARRCRKVR